MKHQSFQEAIKACQGQKKLLLIGNGFSIAWNKDVFRYQAILEQADETNAFSVASEYARSLFDELDDTKDFEAVAKALSTGSQIAAHYQCQDIATVEKMRSDITHIQNILVETIAKHHPDSCTAISDSQYESCKAFLSNFDKIYTINYDLLLYWVINKYLNELSFEDRFEDPVSGALEDGEEYYEENYVKWSLGNEAKGAKGASLLYLHGALHLYDAGYETRKYSQKRTGVSLKNQILESLEKGMYPLFVSGGDAKEKMTKINHSGYLSRCYRSFQQSSGTIFCFGMSFKANDNHILEAIVNSTVSKIYISVLGAIDAPDNQELKTSMEKVINLREQKIQNTGKRTKIEVEYFDAVSANIWGSQ